MKRTFGADDAAATLNANWKRSEVFPLCTNNITS